MKVLSVMNPQWADAAHTAINMDVTFDGIGVVPFSASARDTEPHGVDLFNRAVAGDFGPIASPPQKSLAKLKKAKIEELDLLLGDWKTPRIALANGQGKPKITFVGAAEIQVVTLAWLSLIANGGTTTTLTDINGNSGVVTKSLLDSFMPLWVAEYGRIHGAYIARKVVIDNANSATAIEAVDTVTPL